VVSASGRANIMCYARDADMPESAYGYTDYRALVEFKDAINEILFTAQRIEISCPLGTRIIGQDNTCSISQGEISIRRSPLGVFRTESGPLVEYGL